MSVPRYIFEPAEAELDLFADQQTPQFMNAWVKLKFLLAAYAFVDYGVREHETSPADRIVYLSYAWEDFHVACTGQGEAMLTGAILHLWDQLPTDREKAFHTALCRAFDAAEKATPADTPRSYHYTVRAKKIRTLAQGYDLKPAAPCLQPRTRLWLSSGFTSNNLREIWFWLNFTLGREKEQR